MNERNNEQIAKTNEITKKLGQFNKKYRWKFINYFKLKSDENYHRSILDLFQEIMNDIITLEVIKFFNKRTLKDLNLLHLKCREKQIVAPERGLAYLSSEINRRLQIRTTWIALIVAIVVGLIPVVWDIIH